MAHIAPSSAEALSYLEDVTLEALSKCGVPAKDAQSSAARIRRAIAVRFGGGAIYVRRDGGTPRGARAEANTEFLPFLREAMLGVIQEAGIAARSKAAIVDEQARKIAAHFAGSPVYIALDRVARCEERRAAVRSLFNGRNHHELAARFGVCVQTIYRDVGHYLGQVQTRSSAARRRK